MIQVQFALAVRCSSVMSEFSIKLDFVSFVLIHDTGCHADFIAERSMAILCVANDGNLSIKWWSLFQVRSEI